MITKDLITFSKHAAYLPRVIAASKPTDVDFRNQYSELNCVLREPSTILRFAKQLAVGERKPEKSIPIPFTVGLDKYDESKKEVWFYINGICTDRELAQLNGRCLSDILQRPVRVLHNPTSGFFQDLIECAFERTLDQYAVITLRLFSEVSKSLNEKKKVKIIAHSQGGIIVASLLKYIAMQNIDVFNKLEIFTFASATDEEVELPGVYQEHFANENDFVARGGIIEAKPTGDLYIKERGEGHMLNRDYLEHFVYGLYCNKQSKLYSYLNYFKEDNR